MMKKKSFFRLQTRSCRSWQRLHVKGLNLEKGEAALAGHVDSLVYLSKESPRKEEPLFTRLFR
ncbi:MAG: hypothetical protein ACLTER_02695 [Ruminococcus sp.]